MDKYRIDSHKLMYHVDRLDAWLKGRDVYPVYVEVSPIGACNHRCTFCALDFLEYEPRFLETEMLLERLEEMGRLGVRSIMYAGEGEPLLHKKIAQIIDCTRQAGIDVALTTNGVLLDEACAEAILGNLEWCKVSINAGTAKTYATIHRTKEQDFDRVIDNLRSAVRLKEAGGLRCSLGMQMVLLPENHDECITLARLARDVGVEYLVIKPYSQGLSSKTDRYRDVHYEDLARLADDLAKFNTETFHVVTRADTIEKWHTQTRSYQRCLALPFWSYIDAGGNVWGCSAHLGDSRFCYGNIGENSFEEIWNGQGRKQSLQWVAEELDVFDCRINCRMDKINSYLWELAHPPEHVNFI